MQKLSVITITYNNLSELQLTITSLKGLEVEHVLINGGICVETLEICEALGGLSEPDKGISDAFNKGIGRSQGAYIVFLNSGDVLTDPNYYSEAIIAMESDPTIDFAYADICFVDQFAGEIRGRSGKALPNMPFMHPTLVVRKSIFEQIGGFNLEYKVAMDLDFAYRLIKSGAKGLYIPKMVVRMDGQGISSKNYILGHKEVMKIIYKNRDFSWRSCKFALKRTLALCLKLFLLKIHGDKIIGWYRKKRYQTKA